MESEIYEIPKVFEKLFNNLAQFESVKNLSEINNIIILARGTSRNAGQYLKYLIDTKIGIPNGFAYPSSVSIYGASLQYKKTLVVAFSQSGQSPDLIKYAEAAKAGGAALISITNQEESPLALLADIKISLMAGEEKAVAATKSYSAQMLASFILIAALRNEKPNLENLIEEVARLLTFHENIKMMVSNLDLTKPTLVLGRGYSYGNTLEMALKIQETAKIPVQSFSIADYLHGPISSLTDDSNVFLLAPIKAPRELLAEVNSKIKKVIKIGEANLPEELAVIADSVLIQMFALEISRIRGLDGDSPKGLSKVTLTI